MGANIHTHIEVKLNGKWEHFAAPDVTRDYRLFAAISGERAVDIPLGNRPRAVSRHRGVPEDASLVTRICLDQDRGLGIHGFGWLEVGEIVRLQDELYRVRPEVVRTGIDELDLEYSIFRTYICGGTIAGHTGFDDVRIIYWYDG